MQAVFVLAIVLVTAGVLINAEEYHKRTHDRNHDNKDRNHEHKDRTKKDHHGNEDRHAEKHDGEKDRNHKKEGGKEDRSVDGNYHKENNLGARSAVVHKKQHRDGDASSCGANKRPCCKPNPCIVTCKDKDNIMRFMDCMYQNWWIDFIDRFSGPNAEPKPIINPVGEPKPTVTPEEHATATCTPEHRHYKCVCKGGFFLNEGGDNCVEKEDCPKDDQGGHGHNNCGDGATG